MTRPRSCPRRTHALSLLLALTLVLLPLQGAAAADPAPVRLLVTYDSPVDAEVVAASAGRRAARAAEDLHPGALPTSRVQVLELPDAAIAAGVAQRLEGHPEVVAVEEDVLLSLQSIDGWGVDNRGQSVAGVPGTAGVDIGAQQAWPTATGRGTVVAVVDTGVDIHHPLLRDRIWRNPGETRNGRDDDGNGYVDDLHGWNFADDSPNVYRSADQDLHGTHVAGIIAGAAHTELGFRGVAPDTAIMVLRFISDGQVGYASDAVAAVRYAAANGADVINLSFGGAERSVAMTTAIGEAGIPVVVSAGNTGRSHEASPLYPAAQLLPNQVSVAAVDHRGDMAEFSAYSPRTVQVAAPGQHILSTLPERRLGVLSGTSMAAPFVAGALALATEAAPGASAEELVSAVQRGVRPLPGLERTATGGIARAGGTLAALDVAIPVCRTVPTTSFLDVPDTHLHRYGIACLSSTGVTAGVSAERYGTADDLTRAQVASLVANALRPTGLVPEAPLRGRFDDTATSLHRDNIEALATVGIVRGVTAERYDPERTVTRAEFAGIVARAADHAAGASVQLQDQAFVDLASVVERADIERAASMGLVLGRSPGHFEPDLPLRRDQAATMLVRLLDRLHQQGMLEAR